MDNMDRGQVPEALHLNRISSQNAPVADVNENISGRDSDQSRNLESIPLVAHSDLEVVTKSESEPDLML